jgi:hypothetical protein
MLLPANPEPYFLPEIMAFSMSSVSFYVQINNPTGKA